MLKAADILIVQPLQDEVFGRRHYIVFGPNVILIEIILAIEPDRKSFRNNR